MSRGSWQEIAFISGGSTKTSGKGLLTKCGSMSKGHTRKLRHLETTPPPPPTAGSHPKAGMEGNSVSRLGEGCVCGGWALFGGWWCRSDWYNAGICQKCSSRRISALPLSNCPQSAPLAESSWVLEGNGCSYFQEIQGPEQSREWLWGGAV